VFTINIIVMKKSDIRRIYKERRMLLTHSQMAKMNDLMLIQFKKLPVEIPSIILSYTAIARWHEFDPLPITDYCYFKNPSQQLLYPVITEIDAVSVMLPVFCDDNTIFEKNELGFMQPVEGNDMLPEEIDMVIVPMLAVDIKGYRVGYGKGYYDRFLKKCRKDVVKVAFSYFDPVDKIEDVNATDVPVDYCITHNKIHIF